MFKTSKSYLTIAVCALILGGMVSGCDLFEKEDRSYDGPPQVEFYPRSNTVQEDGTSTINVNLIGEQRDSDITLDVQVVDSLTTAEAGTHYTLPSSSVTIPANSSSGAFDIEYTASAVDGDPVVLAVELQGTEEIKAAPNLDTHTLTIRPN